MYTPGLWPQGINKALSGRRGRPPIVLGVILYLRARALCGWRGLSSCRPGERRGRGEGQARDKERGVSAEEAARGRLRQVTTVFTPGKTYSYFAVNMGFHLFLFYFPKRYQHVRLFLCLVLPMSF